MQLDFFADDEVLEMKMGTTIIPMVPNGYTNQATIAFNAIFEETITIILDNLSYPGGAPMGIAAIFTVGSSTFPTNSPNKGWSGNGYINQGKKYKVNGINCALYGRNDAGGGNFTFYFNIPPDETYCSSKKPNGSPIINYSNGLDSVNIPINEMIYIIGTSVYTFKITQMTVYGKLFNASGQALVIGTHYSDLIISYKSTTSYKPDSFKYIASSPSKLPSQTCEYKVYSCYLSCITCNGNTNTDSNNHNCLTCKPNHARVETKLTNCLEIGIFHAGLYYDSTADLFKACVSPCVDCNSATECITCVPGYYQQEHHVPGLCYLVSTFIGTHLHYYLDASVNPSLFKECHSLCKDCSIGEQGNKHNCDHCINDYSFYENKIDKNCYDSNNNIGYFHNPGENKYYECYTNCAKCNVKGNANKNDCITCKSTYYFYDDKTKTNCYQSPIDPLIGEQEEGYKFNQTLNTFLACQPTCKYCNSKGETLIPNCTICNDNYYFIYGTTYCIEKTDTSKTPYDLSKYYFDTTDETFKECFSTCATCDIGGTASQNNCKTCTTGHAFIETELVQKNCVVHQHYRKFYYDTTINTHMKCYESCDECYGKGDGTNHNCNGCAAGYTQLLPNSKICLNCNKYWILDSNLIYTCADTCDNDNSFLVLLWKQCINICPSSYQYDYENICYDICPANTTLIPGTFNCLGHCFPDPTFESLRIDNTLTECLPIINNKILAYAKYNRHITGSKFSFQVYSDYRLVSQIPSGISTIDFSKCEETLRYENNIPKSQSIIYAKFDILTGNLTNIVEYSAYDSNGVLLDLSNCGPQSIVVSYPIVFDNQTLKDLGLEYKAWNIDIFNALHLFYNDICFYRAQIKQLYTLEYRRNSIFPNKWFCEDNCYYQSLNYSTMSAKCICTPKHKVEPSRNYIINRQSFNTSIPSINLIIGKCYSVLLYADNIKDSLGFYIIGLLLLGKVVLCLLYHIKGTKILYPRLLSSSNSSAAYKRDQINSDQVLFSNLSSSRLSNHSIVKANQSNACINKTQIALFPYSFARVNDNRSICHMFYDIASEKISIIRAWKPISKFEITSIKVFHIIFTLIVSFTCNAVLMQDFTIIKQYQSKKELTSFYLLLTSISPISCVFTGVLSYIMKHLINYYHIFEQLFIEHPNSEIKQCKEILQQISKRIFLYYLITFMINSVSFYYCSIFCLLYKDQQVTWLIIGIINIVLLLLIQLIMCIIVSVSRYYSIVNQSKKTYLVSSYIYGLL